MGTGAVCFNMTMAGPTTGQVTWAGTTAMSIYGSMSLSGTSANGGINTTYTGTVTFTNVGSSSDTNITTNGVSIGFPIVVNINTGGVSSGILNTVGALTSTSTLSITGTSRFSFGTGTVTFVSATLSTTGLLGFNGAVVLTGSGTALNVTTYPGVSSSGGTPSISLTSASPKTAILSNSGELSGPKLQQSGSGALTLNTTTGTGTFQVSGGITNTVSPTSILVTAGLTLNADIILNGTSGNLVTFGSTSAATFTLNPYNPGVKTSTYCSVSYVNAYTAGGTVLWRFLNSTNGGNNTNLTFASQYYWVGGSGTWDNTSNTHWSLTSGGAGAQGPPTSADDVVFDANSNATAYAVTITGSTVSNSALCYNFSVTSGPASGTVTFNGSSGGSASLMVFGNFTLTSSISLSFNLAYVYLLSTSAATLTSGGFGLTSTTFVMGYYPNTGGAPASNYTLSGALTCNSLFVDAGTFDTSSTGNYTLTLSGQLSAINAGSGLTLNFNASTITILSSIIVGSSGTTVNAGTSTINLTGLASSTHTIQFGNKTYYNVVLNNGNNSGVTYNITDGNGTNTFNTFTYNASSAAPSLNSLVLSGNITITSTTSLNSGGTYNSRLFVLSDTTGTQRNINWTGGSIIAYCDFRDINATAGSIGSSGGTVGDCGGNTNVTGATPKTVYWNLAGSQNWSATGWASSSGGTPAAANFPLAQDTAIFNNTGSAGTVTIDKNWNIGSVDMSSRTSAMTLSNSTNAFTVYGSWTNGSGTTLSGTGTITFSNRAIKTINSAGVTFTQDIVIDAPGGGLQLLTNNLTTTGISLTTGITRGTLDLNNLSFVTRYFTSSNTNTRAIAFGTTGNITVNPVGVGGTIFNMSLATNFTYTGTPTVTINGTGGGSNFVVFGNAGGGSITNALSFAFTGTPAASISGYCKNLDLSGVTAGGNFPSNNDSVTVYGNFTLSSATTVNASTGTMTFAATSGSQAITTNGVTINFPIVINAPGAVVNTNGAFTSTSSFSINSYTPFYPGGSLTVSSYYSASTTYAYYNYTFTITGSGACFTQVGVNAGVSYDITTPITLTSSSPKTFAGGGSSFGRINQGGSGALTITGNNTFASITNSVQPTTITVTAGSTQTVGNLNLNGTSGNLVTLGSSASSAFTIARSTAGINTCTFCSVSYMTGNTSSSTVLWRFLNSTNGGNNTNLTFGNTYYWVGGSGTWDNSSNTHWSLTSGGAGAQGPPTANDDVVFDANSNATAYTVTTGTSPACFNFTTAGPASGSMTLTATTAFNVYGSATVPSSGVAITIGSSVVFRSTYVGQTIGIAYNTGFTAGSVEFNGVGGAWTLTNNLKGSLFTLTNGTLTTNNYNITGTQFQSTNSNTRSLNLGSSTIFLSSLWDMTTSTGMTLNAGTSTIQVNSTGFNFYGGGLSYYNLLIGSGCSTTITGSNSFNNITSGGTSAATYTFTAGTTQTVANLNINGASGSLITLASSAASPFTFTKSVLGVNNCTYCSVSYMTGTTTATGGGTVLWRFLNSTNGGNNTNLTFAALYYWVGGSGTWDTTTTTNWSLTSGGSGGAGVPTTNDDVVFDANSNATSYTANLLYATNIFCFNLTLSGPASGTLTALGASGPGNTYLTIVNNFTVAATGVTISTFNNLYLVGIYGGVFTSNGVSFAGTAIAFNNDGVGNFYPSSSVTLGSSLTAYYFFGGVGTFNTAGYSLTAYLFSLSTGTVNLSTSTITVTGSFLATTSGTLNAGTSTINLPGAISSTFDIQFGNRTYYNVNFNTGNYSNVTYNITDTGTNTFNTFTYNAASAAPSLNSLVLSGNITITSNLNLNYSGTYNSRLFIRSDTLGTQRTITSSNSASSYNDFRDINAGTIGYLGGDCGGNSGSLVSQFPAPKNVYWNLAGSQNWSATGWATSSGGTPAAANFPLAQDFVNFDNTGAAGTVTIDKNWNIGEFNMSNRTSAMTLATGTTTPTIYGGSWYFGTGVTTTGTGAITVSRATRTNYVYLWPNGVTLTQSIIIDSPGSGLYILNSNATTTGAVTLTKGTLDLTSRTLTCQSFSSTNTNTRTIAFGTGQINVTGNNSIVWNTSTYTGLTITGTPTVNFTYSGSIGARDIRGPDNGSGSGASSPLINANITAGSDIVYLDSGISGNYSSVNFTGFTGTWYIVNGVSIYSNLTLGTGMTNAVTVAAITFRGSSVIYTNGVTVNVPVVVNTNPSTGLVVISDAFTSTSSFTVTSVNIFGFNASLTCDKFAQSAGNFNMYSSVTITGSGVTAFSITGTTSISVANSPSVTMTSASAKTFAGNGLTYPTLNQGGTGALTISGSNTFAGITNSVQPSTITFTAGTTQTVTLFGVKGTAGNLVTLNSTTPGTRFTISKSSGKVISSYLSLQDSAVTGGAKFFASTTSTNVSNNLGWIFANPANPLSINSAGVLSTPNVFDETQVLTNSGNPVSERTTSTSYQISGILDETKTLTYNSLPVAKRIDKNGNLYVSGYLDEFNPQ
jgi:hypothetical protein